MGWKETPIQNYTARTLSRHNRFRLFRNNVGMMTTQAGRRVKFGLGIGSSDLIGFKSIQITPEMVVNTIAVFLAIETKSETGRLSPEQKEFLNLIKTNGGLAYVVRCENDIHHIMSE